MRVYNLKIKWYVDIGFIFMLLFCIGNKYKYPLNFYSLGCVDLNQYTTGTMISEKEVSIKHIQTQEYIMAQKD